MEKEPTRTKIQDELSDWKCYMFGNKPEINDGLVYQPTTGDVPNVFIRFMMKICFACTWVKENDG